MTKLEMTSTTAASIIDYFNGFLQQAKDENWDHDFMIEAWNEKKNELNALPLNINQEKVPDEETVVTAVTTVTTVKRRVIMTPINLINPSTSDGKVAKIDYLREQPHFQTNLSEWDDSKKNTASIGDLFAHVQMNTDIVELFEIINIRDARSRKPEWILDHHRNRNVLCLSKMRKQTTWTELKAMLGYLPGFKLRGTMRSAANRRIQI